MQEQFLKQLREALAGIDLTTEEQRFLVWLAGWDKWTVEQAVSIIRKARVN